MPNESLPAHTTYKSCGMFYHRILTALILISCFIGCTDSRELSRSRALSLLKQAKDFRFPVSLPLPSEHDSPEQATSLDEPEADAQSRLIQSYYKDNPQMAAFKQFSLADVKVAVIGRPSRGDLWWHFNIDPFLTDKGQQLVAQQHAPENSIPIPHKEVVEVTGIKQIKEGLAVVEFTWQETPIPIIGEAFDPKSSTYQSLPASIQEGIRRPRGPFGHKLEREYGETFKATADFQLYDDGWRVLALHYGPFSTVPQ